MTDRAVAERSTNQPPAADALRWVVHPARGRPVAAAAALGYIVAVTALVEAVGRTPWVSAVAAVVLLAAVADFLLPTSFRLSAGGAERAGLLERRAMGWSEVAAVSETERGLWLCPTARRRRWGPERGLFVAWPADDRAAVAALVDRLATARQRPGARADDA